MSFARYLEKFEGAQGYDGSTELRKTLPKQVPQDYIDFLKTYNGGEGFIGEEYVRLYKAEDLVQINADYEVEKYVPGIFIFGSNGGSEALAFDLSQTDVKYVLIPFILEYDAIIVLGSSMHEFLDRIFTKGFYV